MKPESGPREPLGQVTQQANAGRGGGVPDGQGGRRRRAYYQGKGLQYIPAKAGPDEIEVEFIDSGGSRLVTKFVITVK